MFAAGIAMLLSALYVRFRDVKPIWEVVLQVLFYGTPIIYAIEIVPTEEPDDLLDGSTRSAAHRRSRCRHALVDPTAPNAAEAAGGRSDLLIPGAIVLGLFVLGFWYFNREAPRIAEEL